MNIMRQALAVAIVMYSYKYISAKKFKKFSLLSLLAICVHKTAIISFPLYFVFESKDNKRKKNGYGFFIRTITLIFIIILVFNIDGVLGVLGRTTFFQKFAGYSEYSGNSRNLSLILNLIILVFITAFIKKIIKYDKNNEFNYYVNVISVILSILGYKSPYLKRAANYYGIMEIVLLASIPKVIDDKKQKQFVTLCIILYAIFRFILSVYILKQGDLIPYQTIWNK